MTITYRSLKARRSKRHSNSTMSFYNASVTYSITETCILISVFLRYLFIYSVYFFKNIKIRLTLYQHYLFYLTCMDIFKSGNLLAVTDTCFDHRFLIIFIICPYYCFLLKQSHYDHLLLTLTVSMSL